MMKYKTLNEIPGYRERARKRALKTALKTTLNGFSFVCLMSIMILILELIGA